MSLEGSEMQMFSLLGISWFAMFARLKPTFVLRLNEMEVKIVRKLIDRFGNDWKVRSE